MCDAQYDLVYTAFESRVEPLEEFVQGWVSYVLEKQVNVMRTFLKDYKKKNMNIVVLTNYMRQGTSSVHGGLDVLASGEEKEGDVDGRDDSRGGETMAE